jgi:hypothetical protein
MKLMVIHPRPADSPVQSSNPRNLAASSTPFLRDTTAFAVE